MSGISSRAEEARRALQLKSHDLPAMTLALALPIGQEVEQSDTTRATEK